MAYRSTRVIWYERVFSSPTRYGLPWISRTWPFRQRRGVEFTYMVVVDESQTTNSYYVDYVVPGGSNDQVTPVKMLGSEDRYQLVLDNGCCPEESDVFKRIVKKPARPGFPQMFQLYNKQEKRYITADSHGDGVSGSTDDGDSIHTLWAEKPVNPPSPSPFYIVWHPHDQPISNDDQCIVYEGQMFFRRPLSNEQTQKFGQFQFHEA